MFDGSRAFLVIAGSIIVGIVGYNSLFLQIYGYVLGTSFLVGGLYFLVQYHRKWPAIIQRKYAQLAQKKFEPIPGFAERWQGIRQAMKSNDLSELRVSVIDADTLIEGLLREEGLQGDTMAALIAEGSLLGMNGMHLLSRFHRLRNRIVHESTYTPTAEELRSALASVDKVLVRWGVVLPS